MSEQQKGYFTILDQPTENTLKIQENVADSAQQEVEIAQAGSITTQDGKPANIFKTTQGRHFVRLDEWPNGLLLEVQQT